MRTRLFIGGSSVGQDFFRMNENVENPENNSPSLIEKVILARQYHLLEKQSQTQACKRAGLSRTTYGR